MSSTQTPKESNAPLPIAPEVYARRWWILAVLCTSLILVVAANAGINVGLPSIARQLGATQTQLQWVADVFILAFAGLLMPMGAIGDRFGRKRALLFGLCIYGITSLGALFAGSVGHVMAIRTVMGLGAALIMPATLSLITTAFVGKERTFAIAIWSGCAGAGAGIGLLTSGTLLLWFDWNAIFLINVPLAALAFIGGLKFLVEAKDPNARRLDWVGSSIVVLALLSLLFVIIELPILGLFHPVIIGAFVASLILWALFGVWSKNSPHPLVDLDWFKDRRFSIGAFAIALLFFALMGWFFLATMMFQYVHDLSPLHAALLSVVLSATQLIFARYAAFWVDRFGTQKAMVLGMVLVITGLLIASSVSSPSAPLWPFIIAQVFIGLGLPWASSPATAVVLESLPPSRIGAGSAVNSTVREIGAALGVAVMGSISTAMYRANLNVDGLSSQAADLAKTSLPGAKAVAEQAPNAQAFIQGANEAFAYSFQVTMWTSACIMLLAIGLVVGVGFKPPEDADTPSAT